MWSHDLLNHSFLEEYTKTLEFHGARSLNTWKSSELCGKSSSKNYTLGLTYHIHTHHHFIRNTAKLPSCEYAAKVSSKRLKNKTNWAIVYMAWENCSTFFFFFDWCDHLFWHHIKTESYTCVLHESLQIPKMLRFQSGYILKSRIRDIFQ